MQQIYFATTNKMKFDSGYAACKKHGISLEQLSAEVDEIQTEDALKLLKDKTTKLFVESNYEPIIVSDDSWECPGLNGFPGPYMKSMNHWFVAQNFIDLLANVQDKTIILHKYIAYKDNNSYIVFHSKVTGNIAPRPRGEYSKSPVLEVVSFNYYDNDLTWAEIENKGLQHESKYLDGLSGVWTDLINWHKTIHKTI